jgi:hypothetical protein
MVCDIEHCTTAQPTSSVYYYAICSLYRGLEYGILPSKYLPQGQGSFGLELSWLVFCPAFLPLFQRPSLMLFEQILDIHR